MTAPRVVEAGDSALLLELGDTVDPSVNARAVAAAAALRARRLTGVHDVVPTFRSVAACFDPLAADVEEVRGALIDAAGAAGDEPMGRIIEVPVVYGGTNGPDLESVARMAGLPASEVARRHAAREYRVYMIGFLPGFPYMAAVDPSIAVPRHSTPRTRVAAGSVGIAGTQTGIYPLESPGGWQIIGRTGLRVFDPSAIPPALFSPGDRVRFVPVAEEPIVTSASAVAVPVPPRDPSTLRLVTVLRPGIFTSVQDAGRLGYQHFGVPVSGALDAHSLAVANALVGNPPDAAALEVTLVGPELRVEAPAVVAIAGADFDVTRDDSPCPLNRPVRCAAGSVLRFGARRAGSRAYVAFDGGIDVPVVLGSRSTLPRARLGGFEGRALRAGDRLALGASTGASESVQPRAVPAGGARLRVLPGPQFAEFPGETVDALVRERFRITPASDRMGYRLTGPMLRRRGDHEMVSDATVTGAVQVPPSGEPILLMHDRQTTGGYPQIAVVIAADLPAAGQLAPGDWIEFEWCSRTEAMSALAAVRSYAPHREERA